MAQFTDAENNVITALKTPRGYSQITSLSSAAGIGDIPRQATVAVITVGAQSVRWRDDGTNPTATVGMPLSAGDTLIYDGDLSAIKFIETAASAKLNVSFYS